MTQQVQKSKIKYIDPKKELEQKVKNIFEGVDTAYKKFKDQIKAAFVYAKDKGITDLELGDIFRAEQKRREEQGLPVWHRMTLARALPDTAKHKPRGGNKTESDSDSVSNIMLQTESKTEPTIVSKDEFVETIEERNERTSYEREAESYRNGQDLAEAARVAAQLEKDREKHTDDKRKTYLGLTAQEMNYIDEFERSLADINNSNDFKRGIEGGEKRDFQYFPLTKVDYEKVCIFAQKLITENKKQQETNDYQWKEIQKLSNTNMELKAFKERIETGTLDPHIENNKLIEKYRQLNEGLTKENEYLKKENIKLNEKLKAAIQSIDARVEEIKMLKDVIPKECYLVPKRPLDLLSVKRKS